MKTKKIKSIEAILKGDFVFWVNGRRFFLYHKARDYRLYLMDKEAHISFYCWSLSAFVSDIFVPKLNPITGQRIYGLRGLYLR